VQRRRKPRFAIEQDVGVDLGAPRSSYGPPSHEEDAMKYMLLSHQGTTPLPGTPERDALPDEEMGAVYADDQAIDETPGQRPASGACSSAG
jgi:hypothetical protein